MLSGRGEIVRFTVNDVLEMMRQGILTEDARTELLNGIVVRKDRSDLGGDTLMHGSKHRTCIRRLTVLVARIDTPLRHAQIQLPIICADDEMPEPDFAIVRGTDTDYENRLPTAADVFMVAEAADSSLERDTDEKLAIYAAAGIPQYVVLNLRNSTGVEHTSPDRTGRTYRNSRPLNLGDSLMLNGGSEGDGGPGQ